ncbi:unnamed protein product [Malus baccata var. baccata]
MFGGKMQERDESVIINGEVNQGKLSLIKCLHQDVLVEILSKLPAKSLIRFSCVSKEWYALTKSSYFIARHLHRSAINPFVLLVSGVSTEKYKPKSLGVALLCDEETPLLSLDLPFLPNDASFNIVGSSNGLVCGIVRICNETQEEEEEDEDEEEGDEGDEGDEEEEEGVEEDYVDSIVVWNPATKQFRYLPEPVLFSHRRCPQRIWDDKNDPLLGFDFVREINQYKVVRVLPTCNGDDGEVVTFEAQVFLQSTNSWREVENKLEFPSFKRCFTSWAITLNGVLYCLVLQTGYELAILSFNLHDEVFHVMHLPGELQDFKHLVPLFSWNNSVAILTTTSSLDDEYYDQVLWVMSSSTTTATTKPAWVRQLISRSKAFAAGRLFVGVWKDQHILLTRKQTHEEETNDVVPPENLFVYDPRSETQRKILNHGEMNLFGIGVNYVESLIPV